MEQSNVLRHLVCTTAILAAAVVLAGCEASAPEPRDGQPTGKASAGDSSRQPQTEPEPAAKPDSGAAPEPPIPVRQPAWEERAARQKEVVDRLSESKNPGMVQPERPEARAAAEGEPQPEPRREPAAEAEPPRGDDRKPVDLGSPLVKDPKGLVRLDKTRPVWLDKANKRVVMVGQICQRDAPLEMFACPRNTKEHEAIVSVDVEAQTVHAGLLAVGAKAGHPARWDPTYVPAAGTEIEVTVAWKDKEGKPHTARAQDWILDVHTNKAMAHPWVFAGSGFWTDEATGKKYYQAEGGDFICVSNFPSAMLDLPIESSQSNESLLFRAFTERIPPLGTPVTLLLTPKLEKEKKPKQKDSQEGAEKKAE